MNIKELVVGSTYSTLLGKNPNKNGNDPIRIELRVKKI